MVEKQDSEIGSRSRVIAVVGPTACGKTTRAVDLCRALDAELISADSRQVYRGMDIGTGKDLEEYEEVPFHIIDVCEAGEKYNLFRYLHDFQSALHDINRRGKRVVVCGGSGMYVENALSGLRLPPVPENTLLREKLSSLNLQQLTDILKGYKKLHNTTDVDNEKRAIRAIEIEEFYRNNPEVALQADRMKASPLPHVIIGIDIPRDQRRSRISERLRKRLQQGMVKEVEGLLNKGIPWQNLEYYGLEYKFLVYYLIGRLDYDSMVAQLEIAIHQFAKRQMTWFRGMEKRGFNINWLPYDLPDDEFRNRAIDIINNQP